VLERDGVRDVVVTNLLVEEGSVGDGEHRRPGRGDQIAGGVGAVTAALVLAGGAKISVVGDGRALAGRVVVRHFPVLEGEENGLRQDRPSAGRRRRIGVPCRGGARAHAGDQRVEGLSARIDDPVDVTEVEDVSLELANGGDGLGTDELVLPQLAHAPNARQVLVQEHLDDPDVIRQVDGGLANG